MDMEWIQEVGYIHYSPLFVVILIVIVLLIETILLNIRNTLMKKSNTFDNDTLKSLVNSFILAFISSIGSFLAALSTGMSPEKAIWPAVGALASFLINVPREYMKGEKQ